MSNPRVFVSYVQENRDIVARLVADLRACGIDVWFDRDALPPGAFWRDEIRKAVRDHEYFVCCFSQEYSERHRTYMNEELELAIEEIRLRGSAPWFIPIRLSGDIPDRAISAGRSLRDIQFVELSNDTWRSAVNSIAKAVGGRNVDPAIGLPDAPEPNAFLEPSVLVELLSEERLRIVTAYQRLSTAARSACITRLRSRLDVTKPTECAAAMTALFYIRDKNLNVELLRLARDAPVSVRRRALFYLGESKNIFALPIISAAMSDANADIRAAARQAFAKIPGRKR